MRPVITRFAPSPTGNLHLGGARTALFCYLFAKKKQGKFLLRIEDTDKKRSTATYTKNIVKALQWLEIQWDDEPIYQSQGLKKYMEAAGKLLNKGQAYRCTCTPEELVAMSSYQCKYYTWQARSLFSIRIPRINFKNPARKIGVILIAITAVLVLSRQALAISPALAGEEIKRLDAKAAVIISDESGTIISLNSKIAYIPASVIKVPLVLSAYDLLGEEFRFKTAFYTNKDKDLIIKGLGDPFLISEEIGLIAHNLKQFGYIEFNRILLDDSLFQDIRFGGRGDSDNPYDARFASLLVNFNTLNIKHNAKQEIISAEEQTPTLDIMRELGKDIECCDKAKRINLQGSDEYRRRYVAELFYEILSKNGIKIIHGSSYGIVKLGNKQRPIYVHSNSKPLEQVSKDVLLYSNNLIANALLLQFAPTASSPLQASLRRWKKSLAKLVRGRIALKDGSGLDRRNQMTPSYAHAILREFVAYQHLLPDDQDGASFKTGTLSGVYNAAGYIKHKEGLRPFVIFSQNRINHRQQIIDILKALD